MGKKLLTVNIITYNQKKYISKCIQSILDNKTSFDYDIRIFDDGSTDGTTEICREFEKEYPDKIKLYTSEKNLGIQNGVLLNALRSYDNIETPYYLFIEGDDYRVGETGLENQVKALENHPECIFCGANTLNLKDGVLCEAHPCYEEGVYTKEDIKNKPDTIFWTNLSARIVRTSAISIDKDYPNHYLNDIKQLYTLINKGNMYFLNEIVSVYNVTGEGISTSQYIFNRIKELLEIEMDVDNFTQKEYTLNLVRHFCGNSYWFFYNDYQKLYLKNKNTEETDEKKVLLKIRLKNLKHYLIPPFIRDILNLPRDISRRIKQQAKPKYYFLSPLMIHTLNIPRNILRYIRKLFTKNSSGGGDFQP